MFFTIKLFSCLLGKKPEDRFSHDVALFQRLDRNEKNFRMSRIIIPHDFSLIYSINIIK